MPISTAKIIRFGPIRFEVWKDTTHFVEKLYPEELDKIVTLPNGKRDRALYVYFHPKSFRMKKNRNRIQLFACPADTWHKKKCGSMVLLQTYHPVENLSAYIQDGSSGWLENDRRHAIKRIYTAIERIDGCYNR